MRLEDSATMRLRSIVEPFETAGSGVSIAIEDVDGQVVASAGVAAPLVPGEAPLTVVREAVLAGGVAIGRVVATGSLDRTLLAALTKSLAASVGALVEAAETASPGAAEPTESAEPTQSAEPAEPAAPAVPGGDHHAPRHASNDRHEAELALARRIQRSFVPLIPPEVAGYELAGHYEAAREVGGDFFDVFPVRGRAGRLAITVADVTGKGIAAALLMAFARPLLHAAVDHASSPADALERTNKVLVEERHSSLFITALCAVVELRRGILHLANAGHEPPLHVPAGDGPITWLEASGPLLGAFARLDLIEFTLAMAPGDLVLLYTDGVTDMQAPHGGRFGDDRLVDVVTASRGESAAGMVAAVRDAYRAFQGEMPSADDVTIVAIKRNPARGRRPRTSPPTP
jgi:hypothetical protein